MRLTSLELHGFKSFADKTKISFATGVSSVIGPNGCGKSNVVDAISWVLGEQSAKSLRAERMGDVLFAGAKGRKAQNFAEVTVEFSNEEGRIPLPFTTLSISRRLLRSGESEYLLNKKSVRLKEIQELLCHTGLGSEAFSIIGQGKIGEEVLKSPEARRKSFDAMAGVSRTLQRRRETLDRLTKSNEQVERAKIKNEQLLEQLQKLKVQSDEVNEWHAMQGRQSELIHLLRQQAFLQLQEKVTHAEDKRKSVELESERLEKECGELQADLLRLRDQGEKVWCEFRKVQEEKEKQFADLQVLRHAREQENQKWQGIQRRRKTLGEEARSAQSRLTKVEEELHLVRSACAKQVDAKDEKMKLLLHERQILEDMELCFSTELGKQQEQQYQLGVQRARYQDQKNDLERACKEEERLQERRAYIEKELEKITIQDRSAKQLEVETVKKQLTACCEAMQQDLKTVTSALHEAELVVEAVCKKRKQIDAERLMLQARQTALLQMVQDGVGLSSGAKRLFSLVIASKIPGVSSLTELLKAGDYVSGNINELGRLLSSYFIVETQVQLDGLLPLLRKESITDVSLICLEHLGCSREQLIQQFVQAPLCTSLGVASLLSHPLVLVSGIGVWRKEAGLNLQVASQQNPLSLQYELDELQKKLSPLEVHSKQLLEEEQKSYSKKQELLARKQQLEKEARAGDKRLFEVNASFCELDRAIHITNDQKARYEKELREVLAQLSRAAQEVLELSPKVVAQELQYLNEQRAFEGEEKTFKQLMHARTAHMQKVKNQELLLGKDQVSVQQQEKRLYQLESELRHLTELYDSLEAEGLKVAEQLQHQTQKIEHEKERLQAVEVEFKKIESLSSAKEEERNALQAQVKSTEALVEKRRTSLKYVEEKMAVLRRELVLLEHERKAFDTSADACTDPRLLLDPLLSIRYSKGEIDAFRKEVEELSTALAGKQVNFKAVVEYEELNRCCSDSIHQLQDLEKSENALLALLREVEEEAKSKFMETFERVQQAFSQTFSLLFGGGEASLILTPSEEGDFFSSGVEIVAQPPGKQMRLLSLLSGGEKSLTALSLLFAFFQISPSPCCILDEVDAPLDEANVERLANAIKSYSSSTQFILITHNKRTMAISDHVVGVTMEEKGISKVLQLELFRAQSSAVV